jgi:putative transposase
MPKTLLFSYNLHFFPAAAKLALEVQKMARTNTNWQMVHLLSKRTEHINCKEHFRMAEKAMIEVGKVRKTRHNRYNINYHFVWIPKTRMKILASPFKEVVENTIIRVCAWNEWYPLALQIMPDHVHFFVSAPPRWAPSKIVGSLKARSSADLRDKYATIRKTRTIVDKETGKEIDMKDFWARGFYCGTAGHVSAEQVARYIAENR